MYKLIEKKRVVRTTELELVKLSGIGLVCLAGWNGEEYLECFRADKNGYPRSDQEKTFALKPICQECDDDQYEIIGYDYW